MRAKKKEFVYIVFLHLWHDALKLLRESIDSYSLFSHYNNVIDSCFYLESLAAFVSLNLEISVDIIFVGTDSA